MHTHVDVFTPAVSLFQLQGPRITPAASLSYSHAFWGHWDKTEPPLMLLNL